VIKKLVLLINPRLLQLSAVFILGVVLGGTFVNTQYGVRIDTLMLENENLKGELDAARDELDELKESVEEKNRRVVTGIEPRVVINDPNLSKYEKESFQIEIGKIVKDILEPVKGVEIKDLDYFLLPRMIDNRSVEVDEKQFFLMTDFMVIDEKIVIHVSARSKPQTNKEDLVQVGF